MSSLGHLYISFIIFQCVLGHWRTIVCQCSRAQSSVLHADFTQEHLHTMLPDVHAIKWWKWSVWDVFGEEEWCITLCTTLCHAITLHSRSQEMSLTLQLLLTTTLHQSATWWQLPQHVDSCRTRQYLSSVAQYSHTTCRTARDWNSWWWCDSTSAISSKTVFKCRVNWPFWKWVFPTFLISSASILKAKTKTTDLQTMLQVNVPSTSTDSNSTPFYYTFIVCSASLTVLANPHSIGSPFPITGSKTPNTPIIRNPPFGHYEVTQYTQPFYAKISLTTVISVTILMKTNGKHKIQSSDKLVLARKKYTYECAHIST